MQSLRDHSKKDLRPEKPVQRIVMPAATTGLTEGKKAEQQQNDMEYKEEFSLHLKRVKALDENLPKAYALIYVKPHQCTSEF